MVDLEIVDGGSGDRLLGEDVEGGILGGNLDLLDRAVEHAADGDRAVQQVGAVFGG